MKLSILSSLLCLSLLGVPLPLRAQDQTNAGQPSGRPPSQLRTLSRDELDVIKVLTAQERGWNRGDLEAFASGYKDSPDTLFVGRQISRGFAQMVFDYKHNYPNREAMGTLSFTEVEPHLLDERFATVLGHYHLERSRKAGGNADGIFSLVLEKTDKGWKIILDHTT